MLANLRNVLIGAAVSLLIAVFLGVLLSPSWELEVSAVVRAKPAAVHRFVGDFSEWDRWAQWSEAEDPNVTLEQDSENGVAVQRVVVRGEERARLRMTLNTAEAVEVRVEGRVNGTQTIRYEPVDPSQTRVVWTDRGTVNVPLLGGLIALDVASRLEEHHETALRKLKALAESVDDE